VGSFSKEMFKHRGKEKVKVIFDITFERAFHLDSGLNGSTVFLAWRRGSKKKSGMTKKALVKQNEAIWRDLQSISGNLYRDSNGHWDEKLFTVELREDIINKKKTNSIAKLSFDLGQYVKTDGIERAIFVFKRKAKDSPSLEVSIRSRWVKLNNKMLLKVNSSVTGNDQEITEIDGEEYILKTDSNDSNSTMDTMSVVSDELDVSLNDDDQVPGRLEGVQDVDRSNRQASSSPNGRRNKQHGRHLSIPFNLEEITKETDGSWGVKKEELDLKSCRGHLQTIQAQERELEFLREQLSSLKQENSRTLKLLNQNQQEREDLQVELELLKANGPSQSLKQKNSSNAIENHSNEQSITQNPKKLQEKLQERLKQLKQDNLEKEKTIEALEEEIEKLHKELKEFQCGDSEGLLRSKVNRLEQDLEQRNTQIAKLTQENKELRLRLQPYLSGSFPEHEEKNEDRLEPNPGSSYSHAEKASFSEGTAVSNKLSMMPSETTETVALRQALEERLFIEKTIYCAETGYTNDVPNVSSSLFRTLLSWKAFPLAKTQLLGEILFALEISIQRAKYDWDMLAYWLSSMSHILYKFKKEQPNLLNPRNQFVSKESMMAISNFDAGLGRLLSSVYQLLVRSFYKQVTPLLAPAILSSRLHKGDENIETFSILASFLTVLELLQAHHIPESIIGQLFSQLYYYVDAVLFNELCERRDLCSANNGLKIKLELSKLEDWTQKSPILHKASRKELSHIIEAANLLSVEKSFLLQNEFREQICPSLNILQVKTLIQLFTPENPQQAVPARTIEKLNELYARQQSQGIELSLKLDTEFFHVLSFSTTLTSNTTEKDTNGNAVSVKAARPKRVSIRSTVKA